MKAFRTTLPLLSVAALLLSGCGSNGSNSQPIPLDQIIDSESSEPEEDLASSKCRDALAAAARETRYERSEQLIVDSLSICQTADEWMEMLKAYPGAMGMTDESFINDDDFVFACFDNPQTAVCRDAVETGRMPALE